MKSLFCSLLIVLPLAANASSTLRCGSGLISLEDPTRSAGSLLAIGKCWMSMAFTMK
jgi:hypothetical protein